MANYVFDMDKLAGRIEDACNLIERSPSGMAVNHLTDEAREFAEELRDIEEVQGVRVEKMEAGQTALRLAGMVAELYTERDTPPEHFYDSADHLGSAIWGSFPKTEVVSLKRKADE